MTSRFGTFVLAVFCCVSARAADVITFEAVPGGATPIDDALLNSPYNISVGTVRFFYDVNGNNQYDSGVDVLPAFEAVKHDSVNAFASAWDNSADTPRPGFETELGSFFLRTAGSGNPATLPPPPPGPFIAQCITTGTISGFSGELWDIDGGSNGGTEQWRVEVLGSSGSVLASELSPLGVNESAASLDGLPWTFSFDGLPSIAKSVRVTFVGSKTNGIGFAFNNFSVGVVPEPNSLILWSLAFIGTPAYIRKRSNSKTKA